LDWHGKALGDKADKVIATIENQIKNKGKHVLKPLQPVSKSLSPFGEKDDSTMKLSDPPKYALNEQVATRNAYGTALTKLGKANPRVIALDGDVKNSTFSINFRKQLPDRFIECFIEEQCLVGVATGLATRHRFVPFCSTFACFFSRAFDQLRMAAISQMHFVCCGSHAGISIGDDGPSQMALEDLAMFRSLPGSTVFYPSDAVSTERAVELAASQRGICFIRTGRPNQPVIYEANTHFQVGGAHVIRQSANDKALLIGAGVTLNEAIFAADALEKEGIHVAVLDPFTVKPIDKDTIIKQAIRAHGLIVVVEDHYPEGGVGEAVKSAVAEHKDIRVKHLAVNGLPRSGKPEQLLDMFGISSKHVVAAVKDLLKN